ncbi:MAG: hypothetical protein V2A75_02805 [Pseudomonadota bacterium]
MLNFFDMTELIESLCTKYPFIRRFFCDLSPLVYADTLSLEPISKETVLVLSPNDYWALAVNLNAKSAKEAVKYAPALFDLSDQYRYEAQKIEENNYILIAYNPDEISQKLLSLPHFSLIQKVTFAQWVFAQEPQPIHLPNGKYLTTIERILVELDASYINAPSFVELDEALAHSRPFLKTVSIEGFIPAALTQKTLKTTLFILLILLGNLGTQALFSYQESTKLSEKMTEILKASNLPETSLEREAILSTLKSKETKQLHVRKVCKEVSDLPVEAKSITPPPTAPLISTAPSSSPEGIILIPGSKPGEANRLLVENNSSAAEIISFHGEGIQELHYDGNTINFTIDTRDSSAAEKLKNEITKHFKQAQINSRNTQLEVRLK